MRALTVAAVVALVASATPPVAASTMDYQPCPQGQVEGDPLSDGAGPAGYLERLGLPNAHTIAKGTGVVVGVVDSGVDWNHPKLGTAAVAAPGIEVATGYALPPQAPGTPVDCDAHGTAVAGLIAAREDSEKRIYGVAPEATIYPVRFATRIEELDPDRIADAITAAVNHGARVLNLSFTLPDNRSSVGTAIQGALDRGVVVVASAGNEGISQPDMTPYPAAYPGVLGVAAVDDEGQPLRESLPGEWVDIAAPGTNLLSLAPQELYQYVGGTSFAAALVSGAAALVAQRYPNASPTEITTRLTSTAVRVRGGHDNKVGAGVVDPYAALIAPRPAPPAASPAPAGSIGTSPLPVDPGLDNATRIALAVTAILTVLALVAALASLAVRTARRRTVAAPTTPTPLPPPTDLR